MSRLHGAVLSAAAAGTLLLFGVPTICAEEVVYLLNQSEVRGSISSCNTDGELTVKQDKRQTSVLIEEVTQLLFRPKPPIRTRSPHQLMLQDGTRIPGTLQALEGGSVRFQWGQRTLALPLIAVRAIGLTTGTRWLNLVRRSTRPYLEPADKAKEPTPFTNIRLAQGQLEHDGERTALSAVHGIHFPRISSSRPSNAGWYARLMLDTRHVVIGLLHDLTAEHLQITTRFLGRVRLARKAAWKIVFGPKPDSGNWGYTLVAASGGKKVLLLDHSGETLWSIEKLQKPHDVDLLPHGSLLVCEYQTGRCRQLTRDGRTLWEIEGLRNPIDIDKMANGNVLVSEFSAGRLVEYTPAGKKVWSWEGLKYLNEADVLSNNRVLVTESGNHRVFIANRITRKILWHYDKLKWPMDADLLPGGNILITDNQARRVIEVSRAGKVVWEYACRDPYEADKLPNGNYLIVEKEQERVIEVTPDKRIVWKARVNHPVAATRY